MNGRRTANVIAGIPTEIMRRIHGIKWLLPEEIVHESVRYFGETITAEQGMRYDRFTLFPDLLKLDGTESDGSPIHDKGWNRGTYDSGKILTFNDNNAELRSILNKERQRPTIVNLVSWGTGLKRMRKKWKATHGHE